jgi:hypothetical protein
LKATANEIAALKDISSFVGKIFKTQKFIEICELFLNMSYLNKRMNKLCMGIYGKLCSLLQAK